MKQPRPKRFARKRKLTDQRQLRYRFFEGIPVREARGEILVKPTQLDIEKSQPNNPAECVYATCVKRMLQVKKAFVFTHVAYIESLDENGEPIFERYVIRNSARHYQARFDNGQPVAPGGFVLHRASQSATLDAKRRYRKQFETHYPEVVKEWARKQYQKTKAKRKRKSPDGKPLNVLTPATFRSGTGCVRFIGTHSGLLKVRQY